MARSCKVGELEVIWEYGYPVLVRGAVYKMVELTVGESNKYGEITEHTPDWARISYVKVAACATMERPRQSGHEIEGYVKINGRRYSAFTSGGDDAKIIVRGNPPARSRG